MIYRPIKEHRCSFLEGRDYCSICMAHAIDPSNFIEEKEFPVIYKIWALLVMSILALAVFTTMPACQYPPNRPTKIYEIRHPRPLPEPSPLTDEDYAEMKKNDLDSTNP